MSGFDSILLVGYSGHAFVVAEAALLAGFQINGYTDLLEADTNPFDLTYAGFEGGKSFNYWDNRTKFILGVGDNKLRRRVAGLIHAHNSHLITVIHTRSVISPRTTIGTGVFVGANVSVNFDVRIGEGTILNTGCIVEHGCRIGDFAHVAPGAVLLGDVQIGEGAFIGSNAVIRQGIKIGSGVTVGMGSVVTRDLSDNVVVVGNPAKMFLRE